MKSINFESNYLKKDLDLLQGQLLKWYLAHRDGVYFTSVFD